VKILITIILCLLISCTATAHPVMDFLLLSLIETDARQSHKVVGVSRDDEPWGMYETNPITANMNPEEYRDYVAIKKYFITNIDDFVGHKAGKIIKGVWVICNLFAVFSNDIILARYPEIPRTIAIE